jgi:hypothetical protein
MRLLSVSVATPLACLPSVASACLYPPAPPRLRDETEAQYQVRATATLHSYLKESARKIEAGYFVEAANVYFAKIVKSEEINVDGTPFARKVTARPLEKIKGSVPAGPLVLRDRELTSCGLDGDGPATAGGVSHIVIVFDGVRNTGMHYRSRTYAVLAAEAQHPDLIRAWEAWKARANFTYDQ